MALVDPDTGAGVSDTRRSGWWFEGGGIYRHARIVKAPSLNFVQNGVVARSEITWGMVSDTRKALKARLELIATVRNQGPVAQRNIRISFNVTDAQNKPAVNGPITTVIALVPASGTAQVSTSIDLLHPLLWTLQAPAMYTITAVVETNKDIISVTHGIREVKFQGSSQGPSCTLNGQAFKWRGFCDHNNFAVVGMAGNAIDC